MKIILAPNSLKGSLSAIDAATVMARGVARVSRGIEVVEMPVADGGDGSLDVFNRMQSFERCYKEVHDPVGRKVTAAFLYDQSKKLAVIEMALASGLALLKSEAYQPLYASSYGFGELVKAALDKGAENILLGLGGSATTDAGMGMLKALGIQFLDDAGRSLPGDGISLGQVMGVDLTEIDDRLYSTAIQVLCDVQSPVLGINGAAKTFAPQKGASRNDVAVLESGMENYVRVVEAQFGTGMRNIAGGGAAGGIAASLSVLLNAKIVPGADVILDMLEFDERINHADLVITAEGKLDVQTHAGKIPFRVAERARLSGVTCIAIAGCIDNIDNNLLADDFTACFSLCSCPMDLSTAMENASTLLCNSTEQIVRCFLAGNAQ